MSLPRSTFYKKPHGQIRRLREESRATLRAAIEEIVEEWPAYGYRRVTQELRRRGTVANHKRVTRIMREEALTPRRIRKFLVTTDSDHAEPIFPNLARDFVPTGPDQLWVADITYIRLRAEFVFLAVILDAWSRRVVGYAASKHLDTQLTLAALNAAVSSRRPGSGLIHHSDRGSQYAAKAYRDRLAELGIRGSMSRKGNPYDNAQAESFMKTLKHEEVYAYEYETMRDVVERLPHFIDQIYNRRRLHSALGYKTPEEYETHYVRPRGQSPEACLST
jgi:putative transposase